MKMYLVKRYWVNEATILDEVSERDIFKYITQAKENNWKIVISEIGECVIDWS